MVQTFFKSFSYFLRLTKFLFCRVSLQALWQTAKVIQWVDCALAHHRLPAELSVVYNLDDQWGHVELFLGQSLECRRDYEGKRCEHTVKRCKTSKLLTCNIMTCLFLHFSCYSKEPSSLSLSPLVLCESISHPKLSQTWHGMAQDWPRLTVQITFPVIQHSFHAMPPSLRWILERNPNYLTV